VYFGERRAAMYSGPCLADELATGSLRFGIGPSTGEIDFTVAEVCQAVQRFPPALTQSAGKSLMFRPRFAEPGGNAKDSDPKGDPMSIVLTEKAAGEVKRIITEQGHDANARRNLPAHARRRRGCSGSAQADFDPKSTRSW